MVPNQPDPISQDANLISHLVFKTFLDVNIETDLSMTHLGEHCFCLDCRSLRLWVEKPEKPSSVPCQWNMSQPLNLVLVPGLTADIVKSFFQEYEAQMAGRPCPVRADLKDLGSFKLKRKGLASIRVWFRGRRGQMVPWSRTVTNKEETLKQMKLNLKKHFLKGMICSDDMG